MEGINKHQRTYVEDCRLAFMTSSGLKAPRPAIPIPAFPVPNAAPIAVVGVISILELVYAAQRAILTAKHHLPGLSAQARRSINNRSEQRTLEWRKCSRQQEIRHEEKVRDTYRRCNSCKAKERCVWRAIRHDSSTSRP